MAFLNTWLHPHLPWPLAVCDMQGDLARLRALGLVLQGSDGSSILALSAACVAQAMEHDRLGEVGLPAGWSGFMRHSQQLCSAVEDASTRSSSG